MRTVLRFGILFCLLAGGFVANAENQGASPSVSFALDFPNSNPSHYEITITKDGRGSYNSNGQLSSESEPADPVVLQFAVSDKVRDQVFDLAQRSHYFAGNIDSGRKNLANTGAKTLTYKDGEHNSSATYNYSLIVPVQQLTDIFQSLSTTLEFGRRLTYFHKYQKLALDAELKNMQEMQRDKTLGDVQVIAQTLNDIANDKTVMNVSRSRAMRLLLLAGK